MFNHSTVDQYIINSKAFIDFRENISLSGKRIYMCIGVTILGTTHQPNTNTL